jgi:hypothetical protein
MTKEALKLALEALESALSDDQPYIVKCGKAITAVKEALAQPAQEPVAYMSPNEDEFCTVEDAGTYIPKTWLALYTTPQQRPWVGLTEIDVLAESKHWRNPEDFLDGVYWAETTLKEKNT